MTPDEVAIRADEREKERARCIKIVRDITISNAVSIAPKKTQFAIFMLSDLIRAKLSQQEDKP